MPQRRAKEKTSTKGGRDRRTIYNAPNPNARGCKGKVPYETRPQARAARARLRKADDYEPPTNGAPLVVYRCPQCGKLHIGHDQRRVKPTPDTPADG